MATQLAERREEPVAAIRETLNGVMREQIQMALPAHVGVDKFNRVTVTAIQQNPDLLTKADRRSLFGAVMRLAQEGLLPDGREAAIVMFGDKAQAMPMVAGILKKVRNSGELASIDALLVHANDKFTYRPGIDEVPAHEPDWFGDRGPVIGVYSVAKLKSGASFVEIMNKQQVEQVRNVSRAKNNGPWVAWWGEMARKTVLRRLAKRLPMSTDIEAEFERDETMAADVAAAALSAPQVALLSRLDALEAQVCGPDDEDPEPIGEDQDDITPAAAEEAAGVEPEGEAEEAAASASGGLFSEPEHIALGSEIEAKLKLATSGDALAASWLTLTDDLKRLKAMDGPTYDAIVRLKNRMKAELTGGAE
jgi:recombination protein RecT